MSRNTHDRQRDHQGYDLVANSELGVAIERYPAGTTLDAVLADMAARLTAMEQLNRIYALNANSVVKKPVSGSFLADAIRSKTTSGSFTADAVKA